MRTPWKIAGLVAGAAALVVLIAPILRSWQGARVMETSTRLWRLQDPLREYALAHGRYPRVRTAEELRGALEPFTEARHRPLEVEDGWGRPFRFTINPQNYLIWSAGADDKRDARWVRVNEATTTVWPSRYEQRNNDQVMYNGLFLQSVVGWHSEDLDSVTILDEKVDRSNTGAVYVAVRHQVEIRQGEKVVAGNHFLYELPPGQYVCRVFLDDDRHSDHPFKVERGRVGQVVLEQLTEGTANRHESGTKP